MQNLIGTTFLSGNQEYVIDRVQEYDPTLTKSIEALKASGKDAAHYFASKVLVSGKKSKQGGMFFRFTNSGRFVKVL